MSDGRGKKRALGGDGADASAGAKRKKRARTSEGGNIRGGGKAGAALGDDDVDEEENRRLAALLSTFTKEQMARYESFRRSYFNQAKVKRVIRRVSGAKVVSSDLAIALGGIAKVFAGEIIEAAREDMGNFKGPIHPLHIRNAYRQLRRTGKLTYLPPPARGLLDS